MIFDINLINNIYNTEYFNSLNLGEDFYRKPGNQHYKLLAYISSLFNNINIIDIGTHTGESATALSFNKTNTIYTFDIIDKVPT